MSFFIYVANYFIIFFKKNYFINGLKTCDLYILYRYCKAVLLEYFSTSFIMDFLALNDDVKLIISKHLASDLKVRTYCQKFIHTYGGDPWAPSLTNRNLNRT